MRLGFAVEVAFEQGNGIRPRFLGAGRGGWLARHAERPMNRVLVLVRWPLAAPLVWAAVATAGPRRPDIPWIPHPVFLLFAAVAAVWGVSGTFAWLAELHRR